MTTTKTTVDSFLGEARRGASAALDDVHNARRMLREITDVESGRGAQMLEQLTLAGGRLRAVLARLETLDGPA